MPQTAESVATVLAREVLPTIKGWVKRVEALPALARIPLTPNERSHHLPRLLKELIIRLRLKTDDENPPTTSAQEHGKARFQQGYTVPMLVEESRLLQVSIFDTLRIHYSTLNAQALMTDIMTIADECDSKLKQTVEAFMKMDREKVNAVGSVI
jgi:hypothetical protein